MRLLDCASVPQLCCERTEGDTRPGCRVARMAAAATGSCGNSGGGGKPEELVDVGETSLPYAPVMETWEDRSLFEKSDIDGDECPWLEVDGRDTVGMCLLVG